MDEHSIPTVSGCYPDGIPTTSRQATDDVLKVAKFDEIFIKADSRKIMERNRPLAWVSHPTGFTSRGYSELLDSHDSITAMAIYGVFMQIVKLSVQSNPYGFLQHSDGSGFSAGYISRTIGIDRGLVKTSIDFLTDIRWLVSAIPPTSGCHPDSVGMLSGLQTVQTDNTDRQTRKPKVAKTPSSLVSFCRTWNEWHEAGIVSKKIQDPEKPGKGLKAAWKKAEADVEQRLRLKDLDGLKAQLEASKGFLFDAGWFDATALIGGRNSDRRFYAEMMGNGAYSNGVKTQGSETGSSDGKSAFHGIRNILHSSGDSEPVTEKVRAAHGDAAVTAFQKIGRPRFQSMNTSDVPFVERDFVAAFEGAVR